MPANENFIRWEDIVASPKYQALTPAQKRKVMNAWVYDYLGKAEEFKSLDADKQTRILKSLEHKAGLSVAGYKPLKQEITSGVGYINKIIEGDAIGIVIGLGVVLFVVIAGSFLVLKIIPQKFKKGDILGKEVISFNRRKLIDSYQTDTKKKVFKSVKLKRHFVWCKKINSLIMPLFKSKKAGIVFILTGLFIPSVVYPFIERPWVLKTGGAAVKQREPIIVLKRGKQEWIVQTGRIRNAVDFYEGGVYMTLLINPYNWEKDEHSSFDFRKAKMKRFSMSGINLR